MKKFLVVVVSVLSLSTSHAVAQQDTKALGSLLNEEFEIKAVQMPLLFLQKEKSVYTCIFTLGLLNSAMAGTEGAQERLIGHIQELFRILCYKV